MEVVQSQEGRPAVPGMESWYLVVLLSRVIYDKKNPPPPLPKHQKQKQTKLLLDKAEDLLCCRYGTMQLSWPFKVSQIGRLLAQMETFAPYISSPQTDAESTSSNKSSRKKAACNLAPSLRLQTVARESHPSETHLPRQGTDTVHVTVQRAQTLVSGEEEVWVARKSSSKQSSDD